MRRLEQLAITWLNRNGVPAALLLMRSRHDYRPGAVVKRERLRAAHRQFDGLTVWSADPSVVRLSEQDGIDVGTCVFAAPAGTPPDAADAWRLVGYLEDFAVEAVAEPGEWPAVNEPLVAEVVVPSRLFRQLMPISEQCQRTAEAIEESR